MLSKSRYTRGINCHKSLWLYVHRKNEQKISEETQRVFSRGTDVGILAQHYFPGGVLAVEGDYPGYESAKRTMELIESGVDTIYEATFIYDNTLVAIDILHKENGKWGLYEVKSTNSAKDVHVKDVAVQYYVAKGNGIEVANAYVMHFNREYVRKGNIDVKGLFLPESILVDLLLLQGEIKTQIPVLLEMLNGNEPIIEMGEQCTSPYHCDFYDYCTSLFPSFKQENKELSSKPEILIDELRDFISKIKYPVCHLDFETIMPGVPMFDNSRPYQQIPFQYSIHYQKEKNGKITHKSYLAESNLKIDPRVNLIKQMIEDTQGASTIFVYNIAFERTRINEMIRDFPEFGNDLQQINDRMVDLIIPFRKHYYRTETMMGSSSIKKVLPALCPEFSYDNLEISNGMEASNSFLDLYYCEDYEKISKVRENLLKYCHLDTLAMVKIFEILENV
jgi:hypothetical protein